LILTGGQMLGAVASSPGSAQVARDANRAELASASARDKVMRAVTPVEERIDKLALVCQAMWSLVQEKTRLTDADLVKRVTELDLLDGEADGKLRRPPLDCPSCDAKISRRFGRCLFCGHVDTETNPLETV
jgi:hypothetical protein